MKILWVVYPVFPDLAEHLNIAKPVGGGWMYGWARDLVANDIQLTVVAAGKHLNDYHKKIGGIEYYLIKGKKDREFYDESLEQKWKEIIEVQKPDAIHIHGTEYAPGLALMNACPDQKYVISIQGLIGVISRYYLAGILRIKLLKHLSFRDVLKWDNPLLAKKRFGSRGEKIEYHYFKKVKNVIGTANYDEVYVKSMNPDVQYFRTNFSLRDAFYSDKKWSMAKCQEHSIFISQAGYPLKGLHKVLEAANILKDKYPKLKIRVARHNIAKYDTLKDKLRITTYGNYIRSLINKFGLKEVVEFTGPLNEFEMADEYRQCHVFVSPSSIENSPTSLSEAQLLGTPCVGSYVGGVPEMIQNGVNGFLYRFEDTEMLAHYIDCVFSDSNLAQSISKNSIAIGEERQSKIQNGNALITFYKMLF